MSDLSAGSPDPVAAAWADSGALWLTGRPDRAPLLPPGDAALLARRCTDLLRAAEPSAEVPDGARLLGERAALLGLGRRGQVSPGGGCRLTAAADGWVALSSARADDPLLYAALIEAVPGPGLAEQVDAWAAARPAAEVEHRASELGLAAAAVRADRPRRLPELAEPTAVRPLAGALVVDFSALWAGPLCAHLLGLLGARVVKVETPDRPDGARRGNADFYDLLHAGHASVVLDPDADRAALHALVARADVVIEASRPRALAAWGLDAAEHARRGATWLSITAAGRDDYRVGFGDDVAAGAGLVAYDADGPVFCGDAIADPLTGLVAAATAVCASSAGQVVDLSMTGIVASTLPMSAEPAAELVTRDDGQVELVTATGDHHRVRLPECRRPHGRAPRSGEQTADVLSSLGITR